MVFRTFLDFVIRPLGEWMKKQDFSSFEWVSETVSRFLDIQPESWWSQMTFHTILNWTLDFAACF